MSICRARVARRTGVGRIAIARAPVENQSGGRTLVVAVGGAGTRRQRVAVGVTRAAVRTGVARGTIILRRAAALTTDDAIAARYRPVTRAVSGRASRWATRGPAHPVGSTLSAVPTAVLRLTVATATILQRAGRSAEAVAVAVVTRRLRGDEQSCVKTSR